MMVDYKEDEMLMLSGIQHFMFCKRQWGLIHMEQQWTENRLTTEGTILHENVDNPFYRQKNGENITLRSVAIASKTLGLYGFSDAVELVEAESSENAITHPKYPGFWIPFPIEYKHGSRKSNEMDELQLTAQVMCLEEMYNIKLSKAALFYWEKKHRDVVPITDSLRSLTKKTAEEMHTIFSSGITPKADKKPQCRSCSLLDLCLPQLMNKSSVNKYLKDNLYEETT